MKALPIALAAFAFLFAISDRSDARAQSAAAGETTVVKATGVLEPQVVFDISSTVEGPIRRIAPEGDYAAVVKKGDILAEIDPTRWQAEAAISQAELQRAEARLRVALAKVALAEKELEKTSRVRDKTDVAVAEAATLVAKANVGVAEADVAFRKAALARAETDVRACIIRSPIDGVTLDRRVNVGQTVSSAASSPSLFLVGSDLRHLELWVTVPELDVGRIAKGQAVTFTTGAYPKQTFKGTVKQVRLNASVQNNQVTYTVVVDVDNPSGKLLPYMSAWVAIEVGEPHAAEKSGS